MPTIDSGRNEVIKFAVVGCSNVLVDLLIYRFLLIWLDVSLAKGLSFCCGTFYAYQLNRKWTFSAGNPSFQQIGKFLGVYGVVLGINVATNTLVLSILPTSLRLRIVLAYLVATALSALLNFLGMKFLVFRKIKI